jgi:hypothetical protein
MISYGDPFIEWNEEISARESSNDEREHEVSEFEVSELRDAVVKLLMTDHEYLVDEAEETVNESVAESPDIWNENAEPAELAKMLAESDEDQVL